MSTTRFNGVFFGGGEISYSDVDLAASITELSKPRDPRTPKIVVAPTACYNQAERNKAIKWAGHAFSAYGAEIGILPGHCNLAQLDMIVDEFDGKTAAGLLANADILFVPTGNSSCLLKVWQRTHIVGDIIRALNRGMTVLAYGDTAGIWFDWIFTDSAQYERDSQYPPFDYRMEPALKILPGAFTGCSDDPIDERTLQRVPVGFRRMAFFGNEFERLRCRVGLGMRNLAVATIVMADGQSRVTSLGEPRKYDQDATMLHTIQWGPDGRTPRVWGRGANPLILEDLPKVESQYH